VSASLLLEASIRTCRRSAISLTHLADVIAKMAFADNAASSLCGHPV
jgi:hypothetical protein